MIKPFILAAGLFAGSVGVATADEPPGEVPRNARFQTGAVRRDTGRVGFGTGAVRFDSGNVRFGTGAIAAPKAESPSELRFELLADVLFDFDKAELRPEAAGVLADLAARIKQGFRSPRVRVEGHTDAKGADDYNQRLSERRAESVKAWLARHGGISAGNIAAAGFGEQRPVAPNQRPDGSDDPVGRQKNRRVEIVATQGAGTRRN